VSFIFCHSASKNDNKKHGISCCRAVYFEQIRSYQTKIAAEAGIPESYFGIYSTNPSSADAIRALESRLVKRAERRQTAFGRAWLDVADIALRIKHRGELPDWFDDLVCRWGDPATPTKAAAADAAVKLVGAGILPPHSQVTYDFVGLTAEQQRELAVDNATAAEDNLALALAESKPLPQWPGLTDGIR
jgi:hypothetical protein